MFDVLVTVQGDKVVIDNLQGLAGAFPGAVQRGLKISVRGTFQIAFDHFLKGAGSKGTSETRVSKSGNKYLKWTKRETSIPAGGYPVPVRTGHLRGHLAFLDPDKSKDGFTAGPMEAILYDSALYSRLIHEGRGSSAKFGPRPFLIDAFRRFNQGAGVTGAIEQEIGKEIVKKGLRG